MGWSWIKKVGKAFVFAKPIVSIALPGVGKAIELAEDLAKRIVEVNPQIEMSGIIKEDMALGILINMIDNKTGDHLTDEQEILAREAFRANVAFVNSLKDD